jgi:hypothetical protein
VCRGRYAELLAESKPLTEDEEQLFNASALHAYESFRNKAAESRGMEQAAMQVNLVGHGGWFAPLQVSLPACQPAVFLPDFTVPCDCGHRMRVGYSWL